DLLAAGAAELAIGQHAVWRDEVAAGRALDRLHLSTRSMDSGLRRDIDHNVSRCRGATVFRYTSRFELRWRARPMHEPRFPTWPELDQDDYQAVKGVLDSRALWCGAPAAHCGEQVWRFQEEFARFHGVRRALAVTNGTHAIEASLLALGIGLGDEVIV